MRSCRLQSNCRIAPWSRWVAGTWEMCTLQCSEHRKRQRETSVSLSSNCWPTVTTASNETLYWCSTAVHDGRGEHCSFACYIAAFSPRYILAHSTCSEYVQDDTRWCNTWPRPITAWIKHFRQTQMSISSISYPAVTRIRLLTLHAHWSASVKAECHIP